MLRPTALGSRQSAGQIDVTGSRPAGPRIALQMALDDPSPPDEAERRAFPLARSRGEVRHVRHYRSGAGADAPPGSGKRLGRGDTEGVAPLRRVRSAVLRGHEWHRSG